MAGGSLLLLLDDIATVADGDRRIRSDPTARRP